MSKNDNSIKNQKIISYLFIYWIIGAALPASIVLTVLRLIMTYIHIWEIRTLSILHVFISNLILCAILSVIVGIWKWRRLKKYEGHQSLADSE